MEKLGEHDVPRGTSSVVTNSVCGESLYLETGRHQLSNSERKKPLPCMDALPCQLAWMRIWHCFKDYIKPDSRIVFVLAKQLITSRHGKPCRH